MAESSLKMASHKLDIARKELSHGIYETAVITAYTSMFHCARSLLFADGYKERSHYAIWVYLNEKYSSKIERRHIHEFNSLRITRHGLMYNLEEKGETQKDEAQGAVKSAEEFISAVKKLFEQRKEEQALAASKSGQDEDE